MEIGDYCTDCRNYGHCVCGYFSGSIVDYKKTSGAGGLTATGSASIDFESDLVVWRGSFSAYGATPKDAYAIIKKDAEVVRQYLLENGVSEEELVFSSVDISPALPYGI